MLSNRPALVALLALFGIARLGASSPVPDDRGRPVILLVHGRGLLDRDPAVLRRQWVASLSAGEKSVVANPPIEDRDVRLVWYEDVLAPQSSAACTYSRGDVRARRDAATDPGVRDLVSGLGSILDLLASVADSASSLVLRDFQADAAFLSDAHKRCASEGRLADAIDLAKREGRPVVVVAHSLGSLVAYDYLSSLGDSVVVARLITVGSMVGSAELRELLIGGDSTDTLTMPRSVGGWTNVRKEGDALAIPLTIGRDVSVPVDSSETDPHEMTGYLRTPATARVVLGAWCAAYVGAKPAACRGVPADTP